ncbi:S-adenosyl-L-methionine-dependent methyltransferase [Penicillium taxi]|uniref:S-adenosyl-L-methionine-dependent methyltransferase n=1 Tax=Penicillium taxi TaxID=168475 RepID=UPI002545273F|nr:S-adenosyl-L-methionine-dependent methyltransferase [Penicillium taxi]KAJ5888127.1 S-adenosyl-L-methionine-dependent methyltransferase [Penicillium taxi]
MQLIFISNLGSSKPNPNLQTLQKRANPSRANTSKAAPLRQTYPSGASSATMNHTAVTLGLNIHELAQEIDLTHILCSRFQHVYLSDISENLVLAKDRLGHNGFTYRAARVEGGDGISPGSIDMIFASYVMHSAIILWRRLYPSGALACVTFGAALLEDSRIQEIHTRVNHSEGGGGV